MFRFEAELVLNINIDYGYSPSNPALSSPGLTFLEIFYRQNTAFYRPSFLYYLNTVEYS